MIHSGYQDLVPWILILASYLWGDLGKRVLVPFSWKNVENQILLITIYPGFGLMKVFLYCFRDSKLHCYQMQTSKLASSLFCESSDSSGAYFKLGASRWLGRPKVGIQDFVRNELFPKSYGVNHLAILLLTQGRKDIRHTPLEKSCCSVIDIHMLWLMSAQNYEEFLSALDLLVSRPATSKTEKVFTLFVIWAN